MRDALDVDVVVVVVVDERDGGCCKDKWKLKNWHEVLGCMIRCFGRLCLFYGRVMNGCKDIASGLKCSSYRFWFHPRLFTFSNIITAMRH